MKWAIVLLIALIIIATPIANGYLYAQNVRYIEEMSTIRAENANLLNQVNALSNQISVYEKEKATDKARIVQLESDNSQLQKQIASAYFPNSQLKLLGSDGWEPTTILLFLLVGLILTASVTYPSYLWINHRTKVKHNDPTMNEIWAKVTPQEAAWLARNRRKQHLMEEK